MNELLIGHSPTGMAMLGNALSIQMLETFVAKGILTKADARDILARTRDDFSRQPNPASTSALIKIIDEIMMPRFSETGV